MPAAQTSAVSVQHRLLKQAAAASVAVALVLIVVKTWAVWQTGSVSLLASLVDSILDSLASVVTAVAVRYSLVPPDNEHRFGHGKAQALAGLGQAVVVIASAVFLLVEAIDRLNNPSMIREIGLGVGVIVFSMILTAMLVLFQRSVVNRTESVAIKGDAAHYLGDFFTNGIVLVALLLSTTGWLWVDPALALLVTLYLVWSAARIAWQAGQELMDRELPVGLQQQIEAAALSVVAVHDVHNLRTRRAGHVDIIQMHITLNDDLTLLEAHGIAEQVERAVVSIRPGADVIVHVDPLSVRVGQ